MGMVGPRIPETPIVERTVMDLDDGGKIEMQNRLGSEGWKDYILEGRPVK